MTATKTAAVAALVGGIGWLAKVALIWANGGSNTDTGLVGAAFFVGLGGLVVALAAAGYSLVTTAPVWLRAVVALAFPALVFMVWLLVDDAIRAVYTSEGWLRGELNIILAAVIAVTLGAWGLRHARAVAPAAPRAGGHRLER